MEPTAYVNIPFEDVASWPGSAAAATILGKFYAASWRIQLRRQR